MSELVMSTRLLNESALRIHALRCSEQFRAGKFTRMGQEFSDEVLVDVETEIRQMRATARTMLHDPLDPAPLVFTTGALMDRVQLELNLKIGRIIQNKVQRQTIGKTLTSTR